MSIKPITLNVNEPYKIKEFRDNNSRRVFAQYLKENRKKMNLSFIKRIRKYFTSILVLFQDAFARMLQQRISKSKSQLMVFQNSMKYFIFIGQYLGLFPILPMEPKKKYKLLSWRYTFSFIICLAQLAAAIFCFIAILKTSINIRKFSYLSFYGTTCLSSLLLMRLGSKWHELLKQVEAANLNEYIDHYVQFKCNIATLAFFTFAILDHVLSNIPKYLAVLDCPSGNDTVYKQYILRSYTWFFEIGLPYALPFGIILPLIATSPASILSIVLCCSSLKTLNMIVAVNWSYCHIFVICVSLYLSSIIKQINKKIISSEGQYLSASYWRALRQDYNRATKLVRSFDEVINSIVFASFASNLFFVCLQIYYVLRNDITVQHSSSLCDDNSPTGPYHVYQLIFVNTYFVYSSIFVALRTFIVSMVAAKVHSASLEVAPVLYSVPSSTYCIEVQRFIEQIHGDRVALTGLNFFYVTKELVLSMIGTIVTYELVLLQLN